MASRPEKVAAHFAVPDFNDAAYAARDDIPPTTPITVVALKRDGVTRGAARLRWGLIPHWSETDRPKHVLHVLKSETALYKFGHQLRHNRCLIPADGYFEWTGERGRKRKYRMAPRDGGLFAFAGVWDVWHGERAKVASCAFLTVGPNELVRPVADRMPVILAPESYAEWLDPATPVARVEALFRPYPAELMELADVTAERDEGPSLFAAEVA